MKNSCHKTLRRGRKLTGSRNSLFALRLHPVMELLESRINLTSVAWTGAGGNLLWSNPLNWSGSAVPGTMDDVTIPALSGAPTIAVNHLRASCE